ncbi:MAG: hypothetical protein FWE35_27125 [Streptosporangiales bacterium]|nr:hypothetical protein [Streptosporangiales bacterium]
MKRITAIVTAASASGALAAAAVSAGMLPASASTSAAPRPAAHSTSHTAARPVTRQIARQAKAASPIRILSQYGNGQYVSVVHCQSGHVPPPLHVSKPGTPLNLSGQHPSAAVTRSLGRYKPVYRCSLVIKKKPAAPGKGGGIKPCEHVRPGTHGRCNVTLNTGFGGEAGPVSGHRPRH